MSRSLYARLVQRYGSRPDAASRREVLKLAAVASAGLLIGGCAAGVAGLFKKRVGKRVIIVGGGFAGLACAHELHEAGYDVNLFEARRRVGGRVVSLTDFVQGKVVEGGGELIGANHPTWMAYKDRFKLELLELPENGSLSGPVVIEGKPLDEKQARALTEEMDAALRRMIDDARKVNADEPWRSEDAGKLDLRTVGDWVASLDASRLCKRAVIADLEADAGVAVARQSYLAKLTQVKGGGLEKYWEQSWRYRCKGGNQELAVRLARSIGMLRLKLGTPAVAIHATNTVVHVSTADGKTYEADDVVLAIAPSAWPKIQIYPELPAVLRVQMGAAVKYLMAMKGRFPNPAGFAVGGFTDGAVSRTWDGTAGQGEGEAALVAYSAGPAAEGMRKHEPELRDAAYLAELQKLYPDIGRQYKASRFMDWPADPWTRAGISFPGPGDVMTTGPLLRKGHGQIHFAGEHACYKFAGSMEGALNSGVSLAKRLAVRDGVLEV
ncbi:MAG: FAD-dependent oxidoreductase [Planctomycetota bacterium]|nr:FAD-dependent oxidoreductase [Planctomycetota bacterium]